MQNDKNEQQVDPTLISDSADSLSTNDDNNLSKKDKYHLEKLYFENINLNEKIKDLQSKRQLRELYASRCFLFLICWSIFLVFVLLFQAFSIWNFTLSDPVLTTFIGGTTINVIGLVWIIAKGLFDSTD